MWYSRVLGWKVGDVNFSSDSTSRHCGRHMCPSLCASFFTCKMENLINPKVLWLAEEWPPKESTS